MTLSACLTAVFFERLPALNTGMIRGGTEMRRSFCGSYPSNALRSERLNVPKSEMVTFLPSTRASEMMVVKRLIVLAAVDLGIPALGASCSVKSFLLNPDLLLDVIMKTPEVVDLSSLMTCRFRRSIWYVVQNTIQEKVIQGQFFNV